MSARLAASSPGPNIEQERSITKMVSIFTSSKLKLGTRLNIIAEELLGDLYNIYQKCGV